MSAVAPAPPPAHLGWKSALAALRGRARQRKAGAVAAAVLVITGLHLASEAGAAPSEDLPYLAPALYVWPIIYASVRLGRDAGLLTGLASLALASPGLILGDNSLAHAVIDVGQVLAGTGAGVALAVATERDRGLLSQAEGMAQRMQQVNGLIIRAQEEERLRIARDLHDDTVQRIVYVCQRLDSAMGGPGVPDSARAALLEIRGEAEAIARGVRQFSRELRPSVLDDLGLVAALEALTAETAASTGRRVTFQTLGEVTRPGREVELAFFRICQEALRNATRHAAADHVAVTLEYTPWLMGLTVRDDGRGFALPATVIDLTAHGKLGMAGMAERAQLIGAEFELRSAPGRGTVVSAVMPRRARASTP